jgi:hypothetical protein
VSVEGEGVSRVRWGGPPLCVHDGPATAYARIHSPDHIPVDPPLFAQMATPGGYINFAVESY